MSRDLLFEIGIEELPSSYCMPAVEQLAGSVRRGLADLRLSHGDVRLFATPRRLALLVSAVAARQSDFAEEAMGPAARAAFDAEGNPTKALLGFCAGKGVDVSAVRRLDTPKGEYVAVTVQHTGKAAGEVLSIMLAAAASKLNYPKSMRWDDGDYRAGRPVRWLAALLGDDVLPVRAFGLTASRTSYGHRVLSPAAVEIATPASYLEAMRAVKVLADPAERRATLVSQIDAAAASVDGVIHPDEDLIDINTFLVEWPTAFVGNFDAKYHDLPNEVLITAMREHQRFFAVDRPAGATSGALLHNVFVAVRNGDSRGLDQIRIGNEGVLTARLEDAKFYWDTDLKHAPADLVEKLESVVWMEGLGSLKGKAERLQLLAGWLATQLAPAAAEAATRAALLAKTDLLGEMIGSGKEYASLEGIIGGHYARKAGEPEAVTVAIAEHYQPRGAGDGLPTSDAGSILSLADKLDHVAGAFVAGKIPTGSEDPFGVRRAANGVVRILLDQKRYLDLRASTMEMTRVLFALDSELPQAEIMKKLGEFWRGRVDVALEDRGHAYDTREAALEARILMGRAVRAGWCDATDAAQRAEVLGAFRGNAHFAPLVVLFKRVANILKASTEPLPGKLDRARLTEPAELALLAALDEAQTTTAPLWERRAYADILPSLFAMESAIHGFFDGVMVNVEDTAVRQNRLQLLANVRELFLRGWDLSRIVVEGEKS
ncbi:MAG: glycine--tRNA ligase subunit beta [Candidatus Eisenbacteria bacterium]